MFDQLNKLNICISHTATVATLDKLGIDHDKDVKDWRNDLSKLISKNDQVRLLYFLMKSIIS